MFGVVVIVATKEQYLGALIESRSFQVDVLHLRNSCLITCALFIPSIFQRLEDPVEHCA